MNLGMPRIGRHRELKRAIEAYWAGSIDAESVAQVARERRVENWELQRTLGITSIPSNDFSLYDQVLDTCCLLGALPERFGFEGDEVDLDTYFALARGTERRGRQIPPLEMTKWFDTNYHYLVPELGPNSEFRVGSQKPVEEFLEARALGVETRPVLIGPVTFLLLAKATAAGFSTLDLLPQLLTSYRDVLLQLHDVGATWVQLDEPFLGADLTSDAQVAYLEAYAALAKVPDIEILVATYFDGLGDNLDLATALPVSALHIDVVRDAAQLPIVASRLRADTVLSAGIVDGRNIWRTNLTTALRALEEVRDELGGERLWVGPSCSLLHVPIDVDVEPRASSDPELSSWLAFGCQKLEEVATLARGLSDGVDAVAEELERSDRAATSRSGSDRVHSTSVRARLDAIVDSDAHRSSPHVIRAKKRQAHLSRPLLPTTTIGSFPQTPEIRQARQRLASGLINEEEYRHFCEQEIESTVRIQEGLGLDVLVHGEAERNDMVQYFADDLLGFFCTEMGWVQSYGTRCVRPPILFGDVERPKPITPPWISYAQSLTDKPVKGMLTGPVTILKWSFVRDDQPLADTCRQIALVIRDEVVELEESGTQIIQVDEPALREALPIRSDRRVEYLAWATECFRIATSAVRDETEIHTHMCYVELGEIVDAIRDLDVDVISIEAARSAMSVLDDPATTEFDAQVGPGVYDIHATLQPTTEQIVEYLVRALEHIPAARLWVNPDCGLKTRRWEEVLPALQHMVAAASIVRRRLEASDPKNRSAATPS